MIYGFAKQSGGHLKIYSEVGHGTTVRLYLPRTAAEERQQDDDPVAEVETAAHEAMILVVEDDREVRSVAANQLMALGYRVVEAEDGKAALELLRQDQPIDLLFTDVVMPGGMTGPDLARDARGVRPTLKVLFTSGYAEAALRKNTAGVGEHGSLLNKPYRKEDLARKVREVLHCEAPVS
jgi:CheY-like chemotaxis protein